MTNIKRCAVFVYLLFAAMAAACGGAEVAPGGEGTPEPVATAESPFVAASYTVTSLGNGCMGTVARTFELPLGPTTGLCGITHGRLRMQGAGHSPAVDSGWIPSVAADGNWQIKITTVSCGDYIELGWSCEPWSNVHRGVPLSATSITEDLTPPRPGVFDTGWNTATSAPLDDAWMSYEVPMGMWGDFTAQSPNNFAGVTDNYGSGQVSTIDVAVGSRVLDVGVTAEDYRWSPPACPLAWATVTNPVTTDGIGDTCRWVPDGDNSSVARPADICGAGGGPGLSASCQPDRFTPTGGPQAISCFMDSISGPFGQSHMGLYGGWDITVPSSGLPTLTVVGTELEGMPFVYMTCIEKQNF